MPIVSLPLPIQLTNGQIADGGQVMTDLDAIASNVNANAAASGVNNDITQLLALTSVPAGVTASGWDIDAATITNSTFTGGAISGAAVTATNANLISPTLNGGTLIGVSLDSASVGVTQAASDNSTKLATTAYVQAISFNTALPGISAGVANYYVTNNGVTASWAAFPTTASQAEMAAGSQTAVRQMSPSLIRYAITSFFGSVTPPDRLYSIVQNTTLADLTTDVPSGKNAVLAVGTNVTGGPFTVTTSDGWTFSASAGNTYSSMNVNTAHAYWGSTLAVTPPGASQTLATGVALQSTALLSATMAVALVSATNTYAVAIDLTNNAVGAPSQLVAANTGSGFIVATSSTSFMAVYQSGGNAFSAVSGTLIGTAITLGTPQAIPSAGANQTITSLIQLSSGAYVLKTVGNTSGLAVAITSSGTTTTVGTGTALGTVDDTVETNSRLLPVDAATVLEIYLTSGGGTATTALLNARTMSLSGTTLTANAAVNTASNTQGTAGGILCAAKLGSSYVNACAKSTSSVDFRSITVSGTVPTIGVAVNRSDASIFNSSASWPTASGRIDNTGFICPPGKSWLKIGSTLICQSSGASHNNVAAITASGTTTTVGNVLTLTAGGTTNTQTLRSSVDGTIAFDTVNDNTDAQFYFFRLSISGTTLSTGYTLTVAKATLVCASDTVNNQAVNYGGTWYAWNIPTPLDGGALTASQWLYASGSNLVLRYNIT